MISGKNLANRIHMDALGDAQCRSGEEDPFGYLTVDAPCYRRHFFANTDVYWSRMPVLRSYYSKLDARGTRKFQVDYENAARRLRYSDERNVDSTDSEAWGMIGHYVEAMFSRFDENGSGTLDAREAKKAFPVFYATVRDIFNKRIGRNPSRGEAEGLFTYLLAHGAPPTGAVSFAWWMAKRFSWSFEADPGRVVAIFSELGK
jgi:hypothetical protein